VKIQPQWVVTPGKQTKQQIVIVTANVNRNENCIKPESTLNNI
jgi:hypothetical protein